MTDLRISIIHTDDDHLHIEVNGEPVAYANHDEHGWSGMDAVKNTATAIGAAAGIEVTDEWRTEEEAVR